ncbi:MAG: hypothetical protein WA996_25805 [Candidatus Promineifilaceae bacterium]
MHRLIGIIVLPILALSACGYNKGELKPFDPDSASGGIIASQPQLVTFDELQEDPEAYQDELIRVTGSFFRPPPPECLLYTGPGTSWSLISDDLRLDALGFEQSLQLVRPGLELTVDGIFRKYDGPLGCGKRPPVGIAWFLETTQIVQPNPLARVIGTVESDLPPIFPPLLVSPTPPGTVSPGVTANPTLGISPTLPGSIPTVTPSPVGTVVGTATATAVATAGTQIPTATPSPSSTSINSTPTVTPSPSPTSGPGTTTPIPTNTVQPTPGPTQPPLSTSTPGGYPIPTPPTPTSSPTGYPGL